MRNVSTAIACPATSPASAWIVDTSGGRVLLTHHRKLGRWLQPGGHSDGEPESLRVALREAGEETGLDLVACSNRPMDIDIHEIHARTARSRRTGTTTCVLP